MDVNIANVRSLLSTTRKSNRGHMVFSEVGQVAAVHNLVCRSIRERRMVLSQAGKSLVNGVAGFIDQVEGLFRLSGKSFCSRHSCCYPFVPSPSLLYWEGRIEEFQVRFSGMTQKLIWLDREELRDTQRIIEFEKRTRLSSLHILAGKCGDDEEERSCGREAPIRKSRVRELWRFLHQGSRPRATSLASPEGTKRVHISAGGLQLAHDTTRTWYGSIFSNLSAQPASYS